MKTVNFWLDTCYKPLLNPVSTGEYSKVTQLVSHEDGTVKCPFMHYADDPRYPFACDFYIKSLDLFIELNLYFTHGFHWFNKDDPDDLKKVEMWKERSKGKDLYSGAVYVWTESDPKKREAAVKNSLNYVVLWNLEDIERYKNELKERFVLK